MAILTGLGDGSHTIVWGKGARGYAPRSEMLSKDTVSMIVCTCNLRTPEAEAGGFVFETSLNYKMRIIT